LSAGFLLPAQTLLDLCSDESNPARAWSETVDSSELRMSVLSIAQALACAEQIAEGHERQWLCSALRFLVKDIENDAGPQLDFDYDAAQVWQALIHDVELSGVAQIDRQVYAQALTNGLAVVEHPRTTHAYLGKLGLAVVSL